MAIKTKSTTKYKGRKRKLILIQKVYRFCLFLGKDSSWMSLDGAVGAGGTGGTEEH